MFGILAIAASCLAPASISQATTSATTSRISHIVVIYQENHSFDETIGYWCTTFSPARCDGFTGTVKLADGASVTMQQSPDVVPLVAHSVADQVAAMDGGKMDGWDKIQGCTASAQYGCLTYYTPSQIPNLTTLATQFAVDDRMFSMADSPSWGGHMYAVAASTDRFLGENPQVAPNVKPGAGWGCNSSKTSAWLSPKGSVAQVPSCIPDPALGLPNGGAFQPTPVRYVPTILDRLDTAGLTWHIYADSGSTNKWGICPTFAECLYTSQLTRVVPTLQVLNDAQTGNLGSLSIVIPGANSSQHNATSMLSGDNWIGQVVSAIEKGPQWSSTAIFITYDDCGCFYDHVPPPLNPDGTQQGPRLPLVIVSPWIRPGFTDSTPATMASILAFIEHTFRLRAMNANDGRAYYFSNSFNFTGSTPARPVELVQTPIPASEQTIAISPDDPT
jgi:phospholipase C